MRIIEVTYETGVTISTGQFENRKLNFKAAAVVEPLETAEDAKARLTKVIDSWLREAVDEVELGKRKSESKTHRFGLRA